MSVHFTYQEVSKESDLGQGDILQRTDKIDALLDSFYPQYAAKKDNRHFLVLTQSCDLVRRKGAASCDSRYIALAPVRPLGVALARKLDELVDNSFPKHLPICTHQNRERLRHWLERLLNNNEANYFYLRREPTKGLSDDSCAFLALSIAIKADLHYQTCLDARVLTLEASFQAKLGWLVGQMYSRIGTVDWPAEQIHKEITETLKDVVIGLDARRLKLLKQRVGEWHAAHPNEALDRQTLLGMIGSVPRRKEAIVDRVINVLKSKKIVDPAEEIVARNAVSNDPVLASLIPE